MQNMCEHPFILNGDPNKTSFTINPADINPQDFPIGKQQFSLPRIGTSAGGQRNINKSFSTGGVNESILAGKGGKPILRQAETLDENRIVLYKKGK